MARSFGPSAAVTSSAICCIDSSAPIHHTMSADLFAEFAADSESVQKQPPVTQNTAKFSFFEDLNTTPASAAQAQPLPAQQQYQSFVSAPSQAPAIDDDWGDFEGDSSSLRPAPPVKQDSFAFVAALASRPGQQTANPQPALQNAFTSPLRQSATPDYETWPQTPVKDAKAADPSVLFDAEDVANDDDDFGDFEGMDSKTTSTAVATGSSALGDLLGDLSASQPGSTITKRRGGSVAHDLLEGPSTTTKSGLTGFGIALKTHTSSTAPISVSQKGDDAWDSFDDWEASIPAKALADISTASASTKAAPSIEDPTLPIPIISPNTDDPEPGELPPTNVPPPGILLSVFPSLFADAQEKLFKHMASQTLPMRNKLMAEPATITYLQGYLVLANVAAHIIAGRKLRWKRDQHLSQGMRIGPASSRATSGMKLTGIDKGENMKEEREVSDVVRLWKEQIGRLRHVVSGVNQIRAGTLERGPDLQETMPVRTLKQSEGGIPARQPCMLCGLKREERVTAADLATDDSFGEWWIEQVNMHRGCRNFWRQHQDTLRQR